MSSGDPFAIPDAAVAAVHVYDPARNTEGPWWYQWFSASDELGKDIQAFKDLVFEESHPWYREVRNCTEHTPEARRAKIEVRRKDVTAGWEVLKTSLECRTYWSVVRVKVESKGLTASPKLVRATLSTSNSH